MKDGKMLKICVLGDVGVGKSTLINTYIDSSGDKNVISKESINLLNLYDRLLL
jgi:GTPase SAR1 family protein